MSTVIDGLLNNHIIFLNLISCRSLDIMIIQRFSALFDYHIWLKLMRSQMNIAIFFCLGGRDFAVNHHKKIWKTIFARESAAKSNQIEETRKKRRKVLTLRKPPYHSESQFQDLLPLPHQATLLSLLPLAKIPTSLSGMPKVTLQILPLHCSILA